MSLFRCLSRSGVMKRSDLSQIFRSERFPANLMSQYINLLSKFEVALPWSPEFLLVPSLLPDSQQETNLPVAAGVSAAVAQAMNVTAYTQPKVLRRQYVMSYVPSGFWPRLITRWAFTNFLQSILPLLWLFIAFHAFFLCTFSFAEDRRHFYSLLAFSFSKKTAYTFILRFPMLTGSPAFTLLTDCPMLWMAYSFPALGATYKFSVLVSSYVFSHARHRWRIFPRFLLFTSCSWHCLHIFPRFPVLINFFGACSAYKFFPPMAPYMFSYISTLRTVNTFSRTWHY